MDQSLHNDAHNEIFFLNLFRDQAKPKYINNWYVKHIRSKFLNYDQIPLVQFARLQVGGAPVSIEFKGKTYWVNITHLVAYDEVQQHTYETITLMHVKKSKFSDRCAIIRVQRGSPVAEIAHISSHRPCFTTDQQGTELFDAVKSQAKYGDLLMYAVISYCRDKKAELGIDRLQLSDKSDYVCNGNEIHLEQVRQLMGQYPYYMKFGFTPVDRTALDVLERNRLIVGPISAGYPLANLLTIIKSNVDTDIDLKTLLQNVETDLDLPLTAVMRKIFNWNCLAFYYIYEAVFRALRMTKLEDEQAEYELIL